MSEGKYKTLIEYMEGTGTNAVRLLEKVRKLEKIVITQPHFSMILRGSRRCSVVNAWALHCVTGVPMDELRRWPRYGKTDNSRLTAEGHHA